jgi:hypothetical protein
VLRKDKARDDLSVSSNEKRAVQASRRAEYRAKDDRRDRAHSEGSDEARQVFGSGDCREAAVSGANQTVSADFGRVLGRFHNNR